MRQDRPSRPLRTRSGPIALSRPLPQPSRLALALLPLGALALLLLGGLPGFAQDTGSSTGGNRTSFGLSEKASVLDDGTGTTASATTGLSFSTASTTQTESLAFDGGLGLVFSHNPDGSTDTQVTAPNLGLRYSQSTPSSVVQGNLSYSRDQIQTVRPLSDFIDANGNLTLPDNPDDLLGTGLRESMAAGASVEMGKDAPFGLTLTANAGRTTYSQTTAPDLLDTSSTDAGISGRFSYSPVGRVTLGLDRGHSTTQGAADKDTTTLSLGTGYDISPVLTVSAGLNYAVTDEAGAATTRDTTPTVSARYTMPTGSLGFDASQDSASLTWQQTTETAAFAASLSHGPDSSGTGQVDVLGLSYSQTINPVSGLGLGLYYSDLHGTPTDVSGTSLSLDYNHVLTEDWRLSTGVNYRLRDETGAATTHATGLYLTISRSFDAVR